MNLNPQALEAEIVSHDPVVSSVNSRAQQMIRSGHFASEDISSRCDHLTKAFRSLKDAASVRKLRLMDAHEVQTVSRTYYFFYFE
jgi:spectrin beta